MDELRKLLDELGRSFDQFKAANDQRLKEIEAKGSASAEVTAKVDRINTDITAIRASIDQVETAMRQQENLLARFELLGSQSARDREERLRNECREFLALLGTRLEASAEPSAEHVERYKNYRRMFARYLREPSDRHGVSLVPEIKAAMDGGTDPAGGYLLPPDLTGRLVQLIREMSPIRQFADVRTTSRREVIGRNDLNEAGGGWTGETTAPTETTTPDVGEWKIPIDELYAEPKLAQDELEDADMDIESWLLGKIADKMSRLEGAASVTGNGIKKWLGFATYGDGVPAGTSAAAWAVIEQTKTGVNGDFAAAPAGGDVFFTVIGKTKVAYRQNARWAMPRATEANVRKLKDSNGAYIWQPGLQAGTPAQLAGYPVALFEDIAAQATNALGIYFADFRAAIQIYDRRGTSVLRDPFTAKPYVKFYATRRSGMRVVNFEAIKAIKFAA